MIRPQEEHFIRVTKTMLSGRHLLQNHVYHQQIPLQTVKQYVPLFLDSLSQVSVPFKQSKLVSTWKHK